MVARSGSSMPSRAGTSTRCPLEEIGRNSVRPWTRPQNAAMSIGGTLPLLVIIRWPGRTAATTVPRAEAAATRGAESAGTATEAGR